jgi:outer membrane protein
MNQKNINIVLFVLLGVMAIALFLNGNKTPAANTSVATDSKLKIAYVDLDSIQANYLYYAFQRIEEERIAFAKKGQAITQAEYENFQRSYQTKMQNLEEQKRNMENAISMDGVKTLEELKGKIDAFLVEYNKDNKYSYIFSTSNSMNVLFYKDSTNNITSEVVAGLNKAYNKTNPKK